MVICLFLTDDVRFSVVVSIFLRISVHHAYTCIVLRCHVCSLFKSCMRISIPPHIIGILLTSVYHLSSLTSIYYLSSLTCLSLVIVDVCLLCVIVDVCLLLFVIVDVCLAFVIIAVCLSFVIVYVCLSFVILDSVHTCTAVKPVQSVSYNTTDVNIWLCHCDVSYCDDVSGYWLHYVICLMTACNTYFTKNQSANVKSNWFWFSASELYLSKISSA